MYNTGFKGCVVSNITFCLITIEGQMQYGEHKSDLPDYMDLSLNVLGKIA